MIKKYLKKFEGFKFQISENKINNYLKQLIEEDFAPHDYTFFTTPEEIKHWGKEYVDYFNEKEKEYNESIFHMSSLSREISYAHPVFSWYCGWHYIHINKFLRGFSSDEENKRIEIITNEINKFVLKQDIVCVRRVSNTFFKNYLLKNKKPKTRVVFSDDAFVSTSLDLFYRKDNESNHRPLKNETLLVLKLKKGINAMYLEPISKREEYELLLKNEIEFVIEKTKTIFGNRVVVARSLSK